MTTLDYYTAKIFALSGQPKFRGTGTKRTYNSYYDYARIELYYFLDKLSNIRDARTKGVRIARTFRKMMNDEEFAKNTWIVCPISPKQSYVLAKLAVENNIPLLNYIELEENEEEDE